MGIGIRELFAAAELLDTNVDARGGKRPQKSLDARLGSNSNFRKFKLTYANQAEAFGAQRSVNRRHRDIYIIYIRYKPLLKKNGKIKLESYVFRCRCKRCSLNASFKTATLLSFPATSNLHWVYSAPIYRASRAIGLTALFGKFSSTESVDFFNNSELEARILVKLFFLGFVEIPTSS